jgi:hypothetical protein
MEVVCKNCGLVNDYSTELKSGQNVATCNGCGKYIKSIPYSEPQLYVGKYKGIPISKITDKGYLTWALKELRLSPHVREAIENHIKTLLL